MNVQVMRVGNHTLPLPRYETAGAAGCDLRANLLGVRSPTLRPRYHSESKTLVQSVSLAPGESLLVPVGFAFAIPEGYEGQVRGRSGLTTRLRIIVLGSPGTIDSDYRGEVHAMVHNSGTEMFNLFHGDRFAQLVLAPVVRADWNEADALPEAERGAAGFGSTGVA